MDILLPVFQEDEDFNGFSGTGFMVFWTLGSAYWQVGNSLDIGFEKMLDLSLDIGLRTLDLDLVLRG